MGTAAIKLIPDHITAAIESSEDLTRQLKTVKEDLLRREALELELKENTKVFRDRSDEIGIRRQKDQKTIAELTEQIKIHEQTIDGLNDHINNIQSEIYDLKDQNTILERDLKFAKDSKDKMIDDYEKIIEECNSRTIWKELLFWR